MERQLAEETKARLMLIDHLILGVPELDVGCLEVSRLLGVDPAAGGRHADRGTANALVRLSGAAYLEVLGPDPTADSNRTRWLRSAWVGHGRFVGWAVRSMNIDADVARLQQSGWDPGPIARMERDSPAGQLDWRLTPSNVESGVATIPFLIDWSGAQHPTTGLPSGVELLGLTLGHPTPSKVEKVISLLDVTVNLEHSSRPRLVASFGTSKGPVTLETLQGDLGIEVLRHP